MSIPVSDARAEGMLPPCNWKLNSFDSTGFTVTVANRLWAFEISDAKERSLFSSLQTPSNDCWGCNTLPTNGTRTAKMHWCKLSRAIAAKQEELLQDNPENPIDVCSDDE